MSGVYSAAENFSAADFSEAATVELKYESVPADQVVAGEPRTGSVELGEFDGHEYGVWEHTAGASSDVEADEMFVVLFGAATVEFDGGDVVTLAPGSVGQLRAGQKTVWTVTKTLRKVYFA